MSMGIPPGREEWRARSVSELGIPETRRTLSTFKAATVVNAVSKQASRIARCAQDGDGETGFACEDQHPR